MSFSSEQKDGIVLQHYKSACCRRALISGVIFSKARAFGNRVEIRVERQNVADFISKLIKEFYSQKVDITRSTEGGRYRIISFESISAAEYIANIENCILPIQKCSGCFSSFLRGIFLASGKISDPCKQYSMEFSLGDRAILFADFLSEYGVVPLISCKSDGTVAYFKNSSMIEEFCALAGMNKVVFALLNAKAEGELRQNISRRINCETNNIAKAVDAATKQLNIITKLEKSDLLSSLPEELEATARLRLEYSDLSLAQLAAVSVPPISKSGLSHRLKKIMELGEQLLSDNS